MYFEIYRIQLEADLGLHNPDPATLRQKALIEEAVALRKAERRLQPGAKPAAPARILRKLRLAINRA